MTTNSKLFIVAGSVMLLLIVAMFTVLNKSWWINRVNLKWFVDINPQFRAKTSLKDIVYFYYNGHFPGSDVQATLRSAYVAPPDVEQSEPTTPPVYDEEGNLIA